VTKQHIKMDSFELDHRLANDCIVMGELDISLLLLMNNSLVPWFIIVPKSTKTDVTDLSRSEQYKLQDEIYLVADYIKSNFNCSKLNIAAIGNIVNQLHIHVVGRNPTDYCWPKVVWGTTESTPYTEQRINDIIVTLKEQLGNKFR